MSGFLPCDHEYTVTEFDQWGNAEVTVCEECGETLELEDTRSFYRDEDTGKVVW